MTKALKYYLLAAAAAIVASCASCASCTRPETATGERQAAPQHHAAPTLPAADTLSAAEHEIEAERRRIASLNSVGTPANDFRFERPDGTQQALYDIEAPMTLLIFYNPECAPCRAILSEIATYKTVRAAIERGHLAVVAIYAEGKYDVWRDNLAELPAEWTVGYDRSDILANDIYDLPAMPTLYVLDADKRVLLKDPPSRRLPAFLRRTVLRLPPHTPTDD